MLIRQKNVPANLIVAIALLLGLVVGSYAVSAQDAGTPEAAPEETTPRPAHIHTGTCDDLGEIVYPLPDVTNGQSTTTVEASLDELLVAAHAINVHESAENIDTYIACGEVAGEPVDGQLVVPLVEQNAAGFTGEAVLEDAGDGTTTVSLTLMATETTAEPPAAASPALDTPLTGEQFQPGTVIVTTTENLRLRSEPSTDAEALMSLPVGTQLEVIGGPEEAEGFIWHEVEVLDADEPATGWVATGADFVDPAG